MATSDGGKGSDRRPGEGYADGWERIFGKRSAPHAPHLLPTCSPCAVQCEAYATHPPQGCGAMHCKVNTKGVGNGG